LDDLSKGKSFSKRDDCSWGKEFSKGRRHLSSWDYCVCTWNFGNERMVRGWKYFYAGDLRRQEVLGSLEIF